VLHRSAAASAGTDVFTRLVDTCTLLDAVRDITRPSARTADAAAGLGLRDAAEDGRLPVMAAE